VGAKSIKTGGYMETKIEVVYVNTSDIEPSDFNPDSRVNVKALEGLEGEVKKAGRILVPLALTCEGKLADGHRRLAVAKRLGMRRVPCIYYNEKDPKKLWASLNTGTKAVDSKTWVEAYSKGLDLDYFPPRQKSQMIGLQRILTEEEFATFVSKRRSPGLLTSAYQIAYRCGDVSDAFVREIILWVMEYEQMHLLKHAMADGLPIDRVIEIILERQKMHKGWI
jgi:hypothetical protein